MTETEVVYHRLDLRSLHNTGTSNPARSFVFADELAKHGYQIIPNAVAAEIQPGDMVPVGSEEEVVPLDDPRPDLMPDGPEGQNRKLVRRHYRKVKFVGAPFTMISRDGVTRASVRRVYFQRSADPRKSF